MACRYLLLWVLTLSFACLLNAQPAPELGSLPDLSQRDAEVGLPFFDCTSSKEAGTNNQMWSILQDDRGIIYVGSVGVNEFDGARWRDIPPDQSKSVRALETDSDGRVYVASVGDFGYIAPDSVGRSGYHSLGDIIPEEHRRFTDVWTIHSTHEGLYFLAREKLFLVTPAADTWSIKVWTPETLFLYGFLHNGVYYVHQQEIGLTRMEGQELVAVEGGEQFGGERMQVMLPDPNSPDGFILGTFNRGLFRYDGTAFSPWETEVSQYLRENTLYKATTLSDGSYALGTLAGGVVLLDQDGSSRGTLNTASGFPGNDILSLFTDRSGLVWAGPQGWICQVDFPSPLTRFDASLGLDGDLTDIHRHGDVLYITTQNSVQYLDTSADRLQHVRGFAQGVSQSWQLLSLEEDLLVTTGTGLYQIEGDRARVLIRNEGGVAYNPVALHRSKQDPNRVFVGLLTGLASIYRTGPGRWRNEGMIEGFEADVRSILEPTPGILWLGTLTSGAVRVRVGSGGRDLSDMAVFGEESGLRSDAAFLSSYAGQIVAGDMDRTVRFVEEENRFVVDSLLTSLWEDGDGGDLVENDDGMVYASAGGASAMLRPDGKGGYTVERTPFLRFRDSPALAIYPDEDGVVWFGTSDELIRYDPQVDKRYSTEFPILIRRVATLQDREVYGGEAALPNDLRMPYEENNLRFDFAAAAYEKPSALTFQTMLEGFDEVWSDWSGEVRREYTNLPPGRYTFRVRGRNLYETLGREAALSFAVLPPWYRSIWAYLLYGLLFAGAVFAADRVQRRRLVKKERERAAVEQVELRAAAAEAQAKALEAENERKKNIELLSRIGRDITGTLSIEQIIDTVYEHVNAMMDAAVFGIGLHNGEQNRLEFPATKERGKTLPWYVNDLDDDRLAAWCFRHQKEVIIQDLEKEWQNYLDAFEPAIAGDDAASILYLPLAHHDKKIGVITAQSFERNAYTENHLNILRNLATYTAIALDNADAYRRLNATVQELNDTLEDLKKTQEQLVTQEKMASLGALTAGIAHEIKNPLNFVNNFAQLILELSDELRDELTARRDDGVEDVLDELQEMVLGLKTNARQIAKHGKRADDIVHGMMQHASGGAGERYEVALNGFVEEYVQLAYHGMRARPHAISVSLIKELAPDGGNVSMAPQDIGRVLINLLNNAFDAVREQAAQRNGQYEPRVVVRTRRTDGHVRIEVEDNGGGVPSHVAQKIFEPFFTTKPTGSGTGLGLSMSYDIVVHGHGGTLHVEDAPEGGACFVITLPA